MKFTLSWLKTHLETDASLDDILYALTDLGLEVEGVEDPAKALSDFKIAKLKDVSISITEIDAAPIEHIYYYCWFKITSRNICRNYYVFS